MVTQYKHKRPVGRPREWDHVPMIVLPDPVVTCPKCGHLKYRVVSYEKDTDAGRMRRCECLGCEAKFVLSWEQEWF